MPRMRLLAGFICLAGSVISASMVHADLTMKETTVIKGLPMVGDVTAHSTVMVSGDRQRSETTTEMSGRLARMMAGGGQESVEIVRLDRELTWSLNPSEKTYTEMTFQQIRDLMQGMDAEMEDELDEFDDEAGGVDLKIDVRKTGEKRKIAGYDTEEVVVTVEGEAEDEDTGEMVRSRWIMTMWMAKDAQGLSEIEEFNRAMTGKMGFPADGADQFASLLSSYAGGLKAMTGAMEDIEGIPLESHMQIEVEGGESEDGAGARADSRGPGGGGGGGRRKGPWGAVVTEVSTGAVSASMFEVPDGYRKADLPG